MTREWVALIVFGSLAAGLIVRLPDTEKVLQSTFNDVIKLSQTLSGQLGKNAVSST